MIPEPLHPAVVHFPLAVMILLPFAILSAIVLIRRGTAARTIWASAFALSTLLFASAFIAQRTGGADEEMVEEVVSERLLQEHEEAGERFLILSGFTLALAALGFAPGLAGNAGRYGAGAASLVLAFAGWQVGHLGGELVYVHGAAAPFVQQAGSLSEGEAGRSLSDMLGGEEGEEDDESEEGEDDD